MIFLSKAILRGLFMGCLCMVVYEAIGEGYEYWKTLAVGVVVSLVVAIFEVTFYDEEDIDASS